MTNKQQAMAVDRYFAKGDKRRGQALAVYAEGYVDGKNEMKEEILRSGCWLANSHNMNCPIRETLKSKKEKNVNNN
jgi:hypothetical protein